MTSPLPRRHALETARRLGLVHSPRARPAITPDWRPLWWALTESGALDQRLLPRLANADRQLPRLARIGWLATVRGSGRPPHTIVPTARGREAFAGRSAQAPRWEASSREVARRLIASTMRDATDPLTAAAITELVITAAADWGRLLRPDDVRAVLLADHRAGLLRRLPPPPAGWRLTDPGYRALRAVARATDEHVPRRPRAQDAAHDDLLSAVILRLVDTCPAMVGALRITRRIPLPNERDVRQRWIVPDGIVLLDAATDPLLLAVEVERHGRYANLARHLQHYLHLACHYPDARVRVLVVSARITGGRRRLADAAKHPEFPDRLHARLCTVRGLSGQLSAWGITETTRASRFSPPMGTASETASETSERWAL